MTRLALIAALLPVLLSGCENVRGGPGPVASTPSGGALMVRGRTPRVTGYYLLPQPAFVALPQNPESLRRRVAEGGYGPHRLDFMRDLGRAGLFVLVPRCDDRPEPGQRLTVTAGLTREALLDCPPAPAATP